MTHGIMDCLTGNMEIFSDFRQCQIFIIIQVQTFPLARCEQHAIAVQQFCLFYNVFYRHIFTITKDIISTPVLRVKYFFFTRT